MFFKNLPFRLGLTTLAFLALSACGGDSSSGGDTPEKVDNVSSVDKLPDCMDDLEGDTVLVKDVKADYVCVCALWKAFGEPVYLCLLVDFYFYFLNFDIYFFYLI